MKIYQTLILTLNSLIFLLFSGCSFHSYDYLKKNGLSRGQYNQIANYVIAQSEINIAIGNKEPKTYFGQIHEQCRGGKKKYGNICDHDKLKENFRMNCIPEGIENMTIDDYPQFLAERRKLMAQKMKTYFMGL